jgi:hypothetical protein
LLDTGRRFITRLKLDPRGDVHGLDLGEGGNADAFAPSKKLGSGTRIGPPRMRIADLHREEFEKANAGGIPRDYH